jgi:uncharacterized membrane protein
MAVGVGVGVALFIAGLLLITLRPKANPLLGRVLIGIGVLLIAVVLWQIANQPTFRPDR